MTKIENFEIRELKPAFVDDRGEIFDLVEENVGHVGLITFTAGSVRARHYHLVSAQYSYVLNGEIELTISEIDGSNEEKYLMKQGTYVRIPPGIVHVYRAVTDASIVDANTLSRKDEAYEDDTVRV